MVVRSGEHGKGRSFRAVVLAWASAPVWDKHESSDSRVRPAMLMLACHAQEAGPVLANMRSGQVASVTGDGIHTTGGMALETLKSARYAWTSQRLSIEGRPAAVLTARLPYALAVDPGIAAPDEPVRFVVAPPRARLEEELSLLPADDMRRYGERLTEDAFKKPAYDWKQPDMRRDDDEWRFMPAMALWFCAMVDRRCAVPILPDPLFQVRLYLAALRTGIAGWSVGEVYRYRHRDDVKWGRRGPNLVEWGYDNVGLAPGVACVATQAAVRDLLIAEVRAWNQDQSKARSAPKRTSPKPRSA